MLTEDQVGKILSAQLFALMRDKNYSYTSSTPAYSKLHENGYEVMQAMIEMLVPKVAESQFLSDKERAEKLVVDNLKA
jgi:hypothetical protein